jgi:hypothetical protein
MPNRKPSPARRKCPYCRQSLTLRWCCSRRRREVTWNAASMADRIERQASQPTPF